MIRRKLMDSCGQLGFPGDLVDKIQPGVVVHTPRRYGKTKALLWTIYEREQGNAILVVLNGRHERQLMDEWENMFHEKEQWPTQKPRIVATPGVQEFLCGRSEPVFCDEWYQIKMDSQIFLRDHGTVAGAVGTMPTVDPAGVEIRKL